MKYISKITLGLALCTGLIASCKDDEETSISGGIAVDKEEIVIGPEGGIETIAVLANSNWVAGSSQPWIFVSPANGSSSADCSLAIDSTLENTQRTAQIRFAPEGREAKLISITQFGFGKQIILKEPDVEIENSADYEKRYLEATISSNVNFRIDSENIDYSFAETETMTPEEKTEAESERTAWLEMPNDKDLKVNLDRLARPRTIKVRFRWKMNTAPYTRIAKIRLVAQNPETDQLVDDNGKPVDAVVLTVTQKPAVKIEDNRSGDSLAIVTINEKIQSMIIFNTSENLQNWSNVTLWEATDKDMPVGAAGRIRSVTFYLFNLRDKETFPKEIRYLKYLESLEIQSNTNHQTRIVSLCDEICELKNLKHLFIGAYGLETLPEEFYKLGGGTDKSYKGLETLNMSSNNFTSLADLIDVVNEENFPHLHTFTLTTCRRVDGYTDLSQGHSSKGRPLGLDINISNGREKDAFLKLMTWENLRALQFSYNYIEGQLPTDAEMDAALKAAGRRLRYDESDFSTDEDDYLERLVGDTCIWLKTDDNPVTFTSVDGSSEDVIGQDVPRVLPRMRDFHLNLNFLTGPIPNWVLFHPYFVKWYPTGLFFTQQTQGKNSAGQKVGFSNVDDEKFSFDYYYPKEKPSGAVVSGVAYPLYHYKYVSSND